MSQQDADRLVNDLDNNQDLHDKIAKASRQALAVAKKHGYDVHEDEVRTAFGKKLGIKIPKTTEGDGGADPMSCFVLSEAPGR